MNTNIVLVVCGPSGSGKSTILKKLFDEFPHKFGFSVSHTTRAPRPGEVDGQHYHFTTKDIIQDMIHKGLFLETATFSNNTYGTSLAAVDAVCSTGKVCVLDIEMEGVKQVKQKNLDLLCVFIKPPSKQVLEERLKNRGTESEDSLRRRLDTANRELEFGETPGNFDKIIINDDVDSAYGSLKSFIEHELAKRNFELHDQVAHN